MQILNDRSKEIHQRNVDAGWWSNLLTGESILETRNRPEVMCLVISELSEASEGYFNSLKDDKLPSRWMAEVELADAAIRIHDLLGAENIMIPGDVVYENSKQISFLSFDESLMTIVNSVSAALEGYRKTNKEKYSSNLIQALLGCYGVGKEFSYDVHSALLEKLEYNANREDHKIANRLKDDGKKI